MLALAVVLVDEACGFPPGFGFGSEAPAAEAFELEGRVPALDGSVVGTRPSTAHRLGHAEGATGLDEQARGGSGPVQRGSVL